MNRQYVHLSTDRETARQVARRRPGPHVILTIDAAGAHAQGVRFYRGNEGVWLSDPIPPPYIRALPDEA